MNTPSVTRSSVEITAADLISVNESDVAFSPPFFINWITMTTHINVMAKKTQLFFSSPKIHFY